MNMHMHLPKNVKSTEEISSQNTSKDPNKQSFSLANLNLINDNNLNNVSKKYKNFHQKHKKHETKGDAYYIRIREEDDDDDMGYRVTNGKKHRDEDNVEIFSITSTPEAKKRLRNNINQYQNVYAIDQPKRGRRRHKNNKVNGRRNSNTENNNEEFIDLELSQNNKKNSNISKKSKESSDFYTDIKLVPDDNYFSYDTQYIKYNPIQNLKNITKYDSDLNMYLEDIPSIYQIPRINPKLEDLFPKISERLKKIGMNIYDKEEREENLYKGSFTLVDDKKKLEVLVPCYDDNQVFVERKKKFPKLQKFDEDNDIMTDDEQLGMEIKRGNECLTKFIQEEKENKNYIAEKLSRNNIKKVKEGVKNKESENIGDIEESIEEEDLDEDEEEEEESDEEDEDGKIVIE